MRKLKKYVFVNPLKNQNYGIGTYIRIAQELISDFVDTEVIHNEKKLNYRDFQLYVKDRTGYYDPASTIFEIPETYAAAELLNHNYFVHVRCHVPLAYVQGWNHQEINAERFAAEMQGIRRADIVSSPSVFLQQKIAEDAGVPCSRILHFKNPITGHFRKNFRSKYDLLFVGRNEPLKGTEYLAPLAEELGDDFRICAVGQNIEKLSLPANCQKFAARNNKDLAELYKYSDSLVSLSPYENCSMVVLEAIRAKLKVYSWDTGGNKEIAPEPIIRTVPLGDVPALAMLIKNCRNNVVNEENYDNQIGYLNNTFITGIKSVIHYFETGELNDIHVEKPALKNNFTHVSSDILTVLAPNEPERTILQHLQLIDNAREIFLISSRCPEQIRHKTHFIPVGYVNATVVNRVLQKYTNLIVGE